MSGKGKAVLVGVTLLFLSLALPGLPVRAKAEGAGERDRSGPPAAAPAAERRGLLGTRPAAPAEGTGWSTSMLEVGGTTLLVLVLAGVTVFLLSRIQRGPLRRGGKRSLHVLETLRLGGRKRVHLARLAHRTVILGETDRGLSVLLSLDEDDAPPEEEGAGAVEEPDPLRSPFLRFFRARTGEEGR